MKEDKILYKEFLDGNKKSFEELILRYRNNLIFFITRYVKNIETAEDIFQDIALYIIENEDYYNFDYSFKTYIYMIAKSKTIDFIKKQKNVDSIDDANFEIEDARLLEEIILTKDRQNKIQNVMRKMLPEYQLVIYLTQIEGLSYKDTALIMNKKESQIKTLSFNARKKLRKLMLDEKVVEIKGNKLIKLLSWIIITSVITTGIAYATVKIYERIQGQALLHPVFTGKLGDTNMNNVWVGSFQIAWNEFIEIIGKDIEFEDGENFLLSELNKKYFTKEDLSEKDYYINIGKTTPELKQTIINDLKEKFKFNDSNILDKIDFKNSTNNSYTIYSTLIKKFEFITPFDKLGYYRFANYEENVEYFGINNASNEDLNNNIEVLLYDTNECAVKLLTKENEEIILYRTDNTNSFIEIYNELVNKSTNFKGNRSFVMEDEIKIPYINVNTIINYDELCGHFIKDTNEMYISNAFQNIIFNLNEKGGNLISEASIKTEYNSEVENARYFNFNDSFIIFMKEKNKQQPYFAIRINNLDILKLYEPIN